MPITWGILFQGRKTLFFMDKPCLAEIILALAGKGQRKVMS
jgi:hypothetical protein